MRKKNIIVVSSYCLNISGYAENCQHLFFDCEYSKEVWASIKVARSLQLTVECTTKEWFYIVSHCAHRNPVAELRTSLLASTVYTWWKERNSRHIGCNTKTLKSELSRTMKHGTLKIVITTTKTAPAINIPFLSDSQVEFSP